MCRLTERSGIGFLLCTCRLLYRITRRGCKAPTRCSPADTPAYLPAKLYTDVMSPYRDSLSAVPTRTRTRGFWSGVVWGLALGLRVPYALLDLFDIEPNLRQRFSFLRAESRQSVWATHSQLSRTLMLSSSAVRAKRTAIRSTSLVHQALRALLAKSVKRVVAAAGCWAPEDVRTSVYY